MRVNTIRIVNYKCFFDSGELELSKNINFIVGKNDSGKSGFVDALGLNFSNRPHKSTVTVPAVGSGYAADSKVEIKYEISSTELNRWLSVNQNLYIPHGGNQDPSFTIQKYKEGIRLDGEFTAIWKGEGALERAWLSNIGYINASMYIACLNTGFPTNVEFNIQGRGDRPPEDIDHVIANHLKALTYAFKAERLNLTQAPANASSILQPNAANLADVLNQLISKNQTRYQKLMEHIRTIFPHIAHITAPIDDQRVAKIMVWSGESASEREDLAIPLSDSGTGIGQVLAMLYVVISADHPRTILIDEPQSFLHPGAFRKLLEILRGYKNHQYIITSNAPIQADGYEGERVFLLKREDRQCVVNVINPQNNADMEVFLAEVGARLGDVFGADSVLWVEGKTEEICFPELIRKLGNQPLSGVQILGVISTDELSAKHANRVFDIYAKLSRSNSLLPPALAFIFDQEGRSETEQNDISRKGGGLVHWLPLRMFENYLLEPDAIAVILQPELGALGKNVQAVDIFSWLDANGEDRKYFPANGQIYARNDPLWIKNVHGAKILQDMFLELSDQKIKYEKVIHGAALTRWLIENPTEKLTELAKMLSELIKKPS